MPLRILHVSPYGAHAWAYGGIPRVVGSLTRAQADAGHHVAVCITDAATATTRHVHRPAPQPPGAKAPDLHVFPNVSNYLAYAWQCFTPRGLRAYLAAHAGDFDIAHLHACRNLPGLLAARALARAGVPYVLAPNGTAVNIERRRSAKRVFDLCWGRAMLRNAAAIVAVTDRERRDLLSLGVRPEAIVVEPNPIDAPAELDADPISFRARYGLQDARLVLFLGRLSPRKRVDVLVRAFAARRDDGARLVIAGPDMGAGRNLAALVNRLGLQSRTLMTGVLSDRARFDALAAADVVVYAGEHEIFGLVPIEALLCGTPVIVGDDSGCAEVVSDLDGAERVPPDDVERLRDAIDRMLANRIKHTFDAAATADRIRLRYRAETVSARLVDTYRAILTRARADAIAATM